MYIYKSFIKFHQQGLSIQVLIISFQFPKEVLYIRIEVMNELSKVYVFFFVLYSRSFDTLLRIGVISKQNVFDQILVFLDCWN